MDLSSWIENKAPLKNTTTTTGSTMSGSNSQNLDGKVHPLFLDAQSIAESLESSHDYDTRKLAKPHKYKRNNKVAVTPEELELEYEGDDDDESDNGGTTLAAKLELRRPIQRRCSTGNVKRIRERRQSGMAVSDIQRKPKLAAAMERGDSIKLLKHHFIATEMDESSGRNNHDNNNSQQRRHCETTTTTESPQQPSPDTTNNKAPRRRRKPRRMSGCHTEVATKQELDAPKLAEFMKRENSFYVAGAKRLPSRRASMTF